MTTWRIRIASRMVARTRPNITLFTYIASLVITNLQNAGLSSAVWTLHMRTIPRRLARREAQCHYYVYITVDCCRTPGPTNIHVACRCAFFTSSDLAPIPRCTSQHCCCSCLFQSRHKSFSVCYVTLSFCLMNV
jgi:hypothetical protein